MISKTDYNVKEPKLGRKNRSVANVLLPLYINWPITKNFSVKILSEMIDSSIKNLEEVEYDN